ncbi:thioredoxin [Patescibacteria group bacterium]|jgi:thioredoxin 1|nr:thioredoxin [Candidatus Uhrbacteria bacterium]MCK9360678.1 thioredoxin [Patescibacteria group bacterium]
MAHTYTDANFESDVLKSDVPVVVDFWAEWCPPCKLMGPIVEEVAGEIDEAKMKIGKLDVDANQTTAMKYNVMSIPTMLVFKNGEVADKIVGSMPKEKLMEKLAPHLA